MTDQGSGQPRAGEGGASPRRRTTLVTGAAGFIGPHVVRALLDSGRDVVGLDVKPFAAEGRFILGDDLDRVPLELGSVADVPRVLDVVRGHRPHEIVHLGMIIDMAWLARNRGAGIDINLGGALNVFEAAVNFDVERVVAFSSIGVLPSVRYQPIDVVHPIVVGDRGPASDFYGAAKAAAEVFGFAYRQALGLDVRFVRPSAVYGLGMTVWVGPIKAFVEHAVRGEPCHVERGGPHPRDYTHARDIAGLVLALLGAPEGADRVFYGATGRPLVTTSEVARIVREVVPGADVSIGDEVADEERAVMSLRGQLSIENARAQLGWEPVYGDVRAGVAQYAEQYRAFLAASA